MKDQPELKIYELPVADLVPYARNAKEHSASQVDTIAASIEEFGNCDPIAVWHNDKGEPEIVEGHGRLLALKKLGHDVAPVIYLDHLSDEQRRAYTHVHNQTTLNSDFDYEVLLPELHELEATTGLDFDDFGFELGDGGEVEGLSEDYSQNVGKVTYEPRETAWIATDLFSMDDRFDKIIEDVENEELRAMLKLRAAWFCDFDYAKIADYYAYQATPEVQRAFEALGLVLLDRDQLIENGFSDIVDGLGGGYHE